MQGTSDPLAGAALSIIGPSINATVNSSSNGFWEYGEVIGPVTITPSMDGYTFEPAMLSANTFDSSLNFVAVPVPSSYSISGLITDADGQGIADVVLSFGEGNGMTATGANGSWSMSGLQGVISVTPAKPGWSFNPTGRTVDAAANNVNFTASYTVSGTVTQWNGSPLAGADITITGGFGTFAAVSASDGIWSKSGLYGTAQISVAKTGWYFAPASRTADTPATDLNFTASPLGRIAFLSTRAGANTSEVYIMAGDGSGQARLTYGGNNYKAIHWSKDGTKIAVADSGGNIWAIDAQTGTGTQITSGYSNDYPAWSPDGTKIAFSSYRNSTWDIYIMDANGSNETRVTYTTNAGEFEFHPAWSPDGSRLAYVRKTNIFVINLDTRVETQLTFTSAEQEDSPCWSPDGTKIAYSMTNSSTAITDIFIMNASDGSSKVNLTCDANDDMLPCWSPDGTKLAYSSSRDGNWEIYSVTVSGAIQTNLTNFVSETDIFPVWIAP